MSWKCILSHFGSGSTYAEAVRIGRASCDSICAGPRGAILEVQQPSGGILIGDSSNSRFSFDVCVHIGNDDGGLVFGRREVRVINFEGADAVQLQTPTGVTAVQASVERCLERLKLFGPDLHVESATVICPDVLYVFLQV